MAAILLSKMKVTTLSFFRINIDKYISCNFSWCVVDADALRGAAVLIKSGTCLSEVKALNVQGVGILHHDLLCSGVVDL